MPMGHATALLLASHSRAQATYVQASPPRETCASDPRYDAQVPIWPSLPIPLLPTPKNVRFFPHPSRASDRRREGKSGVCRLGCIRAGRGRTGCLFGGMMRGAGKGDTVERERGVFLPAICRLVSSGDTSQHSKGPARRMRAGCHRSPKGRAYPDDAGVHVRVSFMRPG